MRDSLQTIMKKIKDVRHFATETVEEQPRETYAGRSARSRKAKEELKTLTEAYRQVLVSSSVFILVHGAHREDFIKSVVEDLKFFSADSDEFYSSIVDQVAPSLYMGREMSPNVLDVVGRVLENKAMEIGILGYPLMTFKQEYRRVIKSRDEFLDVIRTAVATQIGAEVVGVQAAKSILEAALAAEHQAKTTPILLSVKDASTIPLLRQGLGRLTTRIATVDAGVDGSDPLDAKAKKAILNELKYQITGVREELEEKIKVAAEPFVGKVATPEVAADLEASVAAVVEETLSETKPTKPNKNRGNKQS